MVFFENLFMKITDNDARIYGYWNGQQIKKTSFQKPEKTMDQSQCDCLEEKGQKKTLGGLNQSNICLFDFHPTKFSTALMPK